MAHWCQQWDLTADLLLMEGTVKCVKCILVHQALACESAAALDL